MAKIIVIGGGIIGLSSAYYLLQKGHRITIIDRTDMLDGCSYGNAGYVSPSHFIPLASPGIVKQGFKWMANFKSPFYVQPRLSKSLANWGIKFIKSATKAHVDASAIPLRDINLLSKQLYEDLCNVPGFSFYYANKGMLDFFKTDENAHHAEEMVTASKELGLDATLLTKKEVEHMEPGLNMDIKGAIYFKCDSHMYPNKLMKDMIAFLANNGVTIKTGEEVKAFIKEGNSIKWVRTNASEYFGEHIVLAAGAWSGEVAARLNLNIPMVGGRGYSMTFEDLPFKIKQPIILSEARVALTPMAENKIRFGGTMEITSMNTPPKMNRVKGIIESVKKYFPDVEIPFPEKDKIWFGFRPCSADGLPYIGKVNKYKNIVVASGHAMLGLSLGPATGKLVSEIISGEATSMSIKPFSPDRFN
ncbi:MAG: NAD(P)/FAD-dependent oxidoreductase [Ginsengibacter sp.]